MAGAWKTVGDIEFNPKAAIPAKYHDLIDLARESDALKAFERVLRFDPNHAEALRYRRLLLRGRL